jgi:hypothetical protein
MQPANAWTERLFQNNPLNKFIEVFWMPPFLQKRRLFRSFLKKAAPKTSVILKRTFETVSERNALPGTFLPGRRMLFE